HHSTGRALAHWPVVSGAGRSGDSPVHERPPDRRDSERIAHPAGDSAIARRRVELELRFLGRARAALCARGNLALADAAGYRGKPGSTLVARLDEGGDLAAGPLDGWADSGLFRRERLHTRFLADRRAAW